MLPILSEKGGKNLKISVVEFAESRNVKPDTVTTYMRRHNMIDDSKGKSWKYMLDSNSDVYKELDKKYPLPQPVIIQEDVETIKELSETRRELADEKQKNNELVMELAKAQQMIAQIDSIKALVELRENELSDTKKSLTEAQESLQEQTIQKELLQAEIDRIKIDTEEKIKELKNELEIEQNKKWYHKLLGR